MKSQNIIRFGFWVGLISALVIAFFLFPILENYIIGVLAMLIIYSIAKFRARLGVRKVLTAEQATNASLHNGSMQ